MAVVIKKRKNKGWLSGQLKYCSTEPACYFPLSVVLDAALTGPMMVGIINSGADWIYFKALLRVCVGSDGISFQTLQRGGAQFSQEPKLLLSWRWSQCLPSVLEQQQQLVDFCLSRLGAWCPHINVSTGLLCLLWWINYQPWSQVSIPASVSAFLSPGEGMLTCFVEVFIISPFFRFHPSSAPHSRSNCHSVGGSHGGSPGCSRGAPLTNGEMNEEQIPVSGSSVRSQSSKTHDSPGNSTGIWEVD